MSKEEVKLSMNVNGNSKVPPGFRFHPTEEELLHYYLRKKVAYENIDLDVIQEVDLNKLEPWDIQEKCNIGSNQLQQNDWYFFSRKDKKYPSGTRTNRSTAAGFWKATGRDKVIHDNSLQRTAGMRKTLVFYKGRAPYGQKSDWIIYEYRLIADHDINIPIQDSKLIMIHASNLCHSAHEEGWVVCRLFRKKNYVYQNSKRTLSRSKDTRTHELQSSNKKDDGVVEQSLIMCKHDAENFTTTHDAKQQLTNPINNDTYIPLPGLEYSPTKMSSTINFDQGLGVNNYNDSMSKDYDRVDIVDKFLASQLDGQMEETKHFISCYDQDQSDDDEKFCFTADRNEPVLAPSDDDLWGLCRSPVDPLYHLSV